MSPDRRKRHLKILELISTRAVRTQEELAEALAAGGWEVTQSSVSRDIADRMAGFGVEPNRIRVVYSGVDTERFHPRPRFRRRWRGCAGGCRMFRSIADTI